MTDTVVFPDAVAVWRTALLAAITDIDGLVVAEDAGAPEDGVSVTDVFVNLVRTGGPRANIVADRPMVTADSYDQADGRAVASSVRTATNAMRGTVVDVGEDRIVIGRVTELSGPARLWDPARRRRFHRQTFTIVMRTAPAPATS